MHPLHGPTTTLSVLIEVIINLHYVFVNQYNKRLYKNVFQVMFYTVLFQEHRL